MTAGQRPMTPLRRAVWTCVRYGTPFGLADVSGLVAGSIAPKAIRGYLAALARLQVVIPLRHGWIRGPSAGPWLDAEPRTNPGGRARAYLAAREARDSLRVRAWKAAIGRDLTPEEQAAVCSDPSARGPRVGALPLDPAQFAGALSFSIQQAAGLLGRNEDTVRQWIHKGILNHVNIEGRMHIPLAEIRRIMGLPP